jgi:hypothetical protein
MDKKKMLGDDHATRARNKKSKPAIKMLPGFVARVLIRCGKPNCKCARGERHVAFYHVTYSEGVRQRQYVRRAEVEKVRASCAAHRKFQADLLAGRRRYKLLLAMARQIIREAQ